MEPAERKIAWEKVRQKSRFHHAFRGWLVFLKTTRNLPVHLGGASLALALGVYLDVSRVEFALLVIAAGLVIISEGFNSAIEIDIDLTSPEYHPYARDTKDVAAGAVLLSCAVALAVGIIIFVPRIFAII